MPADPLWARLLIAGLPSLFAIFVAWFVFRLNRNSERQRWVLDQKKAEWQEILNLASQIELFLPSVATGQELIDGVCDPKFRQHLRDLSTATLKCIFIGEAEASAVYNLTVDVQHAIEAAKIQMEAHIVDAYGATVQGIPRPVQAAKQVQEELIRLWHEARRLSRLDLVERPLPNWRTPFWRRKPKNDIARQDPPNK